MTTERSLAYLTWPLMVLLAVGLLVLLLRWSQSNGRSLAQRRPRVGAPQEYGLLVAVAEPATWIEGEQLRLRLAEAQIPATLAPTTAGPRVMVFPDHAGVARALLAEPPPPTG